MSTAKPVLLQLLPLPFAQAEQRLAQRFDIIQFWKEADSDAMLAARRDDIAVLATSGLTPVSAEFIDKLPNLRAICNHGVGYDAIDVKHAQQKGIQVSNTPDVLNDCVADMAMGLLLAAARRVSQADRHVRAGKWSGDGPFPLGVKVSHKKIGIVGLGRIGMAIARRAAGFSMDVRYHNRRQRSDVDLPYVSSLNDLAAWADFLVIATVGGPATRHLVNREVIQALGPGGILVNIARGSVVDENALVAALLHGELGGAGLDVYESEPRVPDALKTLDNVVLAPHIASATAETRKAMIDLVVDNLEAFASTGKLITPIPPL